MTDVYDQQIIKLHDTIRAQDVLLRQCIIYIHSVKTEIKQMSKPAILFGNYLTSESGALKIINMSCDYDCETIILLNSETNLIELSVDQLEKMEYLREIRFQFVKTYSPGVNTTIDLVKMGEKMDYDKFILWCSSRRIRLSMTIGGCPVSVNWKYVFM